MTKPSNLIQIQLNDTERTVLRGGLVEWSGPCRCSEELAVAMDFKSLSDFELQRHHLIEAIEAGHPLSRRDWRRVLLVTEISLMWNVVGSGLDVEVYGGLFPTRKSSPC